MRRWLSGFFGWTTFAAGLLAVVAVFAGLPLEGFTAAGRALRVACSSDAQCAPDQVCRLIRPLERATDSYTPPTWGGCVRDPEAPEVTLAEMPASVATLSVAASGTVVDNRVVVSAQFRVDGVAIGDALAPGAGGTVSLVLPLPSGEGVHGIELVGVDAAGNTAMASRSVYLDLTPPALEGVPDDLTLGASGPEGAVATWEVPTAIDAVDGPVAVSCLPTSGALFPLGRTRVVCGAHDAAGNLSERYFTVHVFRGAGVYVNAYRNTSIVSYRWEEAYPALALDHVDGILGSFVWTHLEKADGSMRWGELDELVRTAWIHGKQVSLALSAGVNVPERVCQLADPAHVVQIVQAAHNGEDAECAGHARRMLVPWDRTFLDEWGAFIRVVADHLRTTCADVGETLPCVSGTLYDVVSIVALSGFNLATEELRLPLTFESDDPSCAAIEYGGCGMAPETIQSVCVGPVCRVPNTENLLAAGFRFDVALEAWAEIAGVFSEEFPDQLLKMAIIPGGQAFPEDPQCTTGDCDRLTDRLIGHGLDPGHGFHDRLSVLWAALGNVQLPSAGVPTIVTDAGRDGAIVGFQSNQAGKTADGVSRAGCTVSGEPDLVGCENPASGPPAFSELLGNGIGAGARFLELFVPDLDPGYAARFPGGLALAVPWFRGYDAYVHCAREKLLGWSGTWPAAPAPVALTAVSETAVLAEWSRNGNPDWTWYTAMIEDVHGASLATPAQGFDITSATFTGLVPGTTYAVRGLSEVRLPDAFGTPHEDICMSDSVLLGTITTPLPVQ